MPLRSQLLAAALMAGPGLVGARALGAQGAGAAARVDSVVTATMAAHSIPGMSVVVMRGAATLIAKGYGTADRAAGTPATAGTVYQIGSISKQFTAAAVLRLAERGALGLDDPVARHLPGFRAAGDSVRLRHLLHQTSGLHEEFTLPGYGELISDTTRPNAELMAMIARAPLGFAPGSRWSYSNSNYALLAAVVERIAGVPYDRFLAAEFLAPLGLGSLHQCAPLPTAPHHARGYVLDGRHPVPAPPENMHWIRGDGGLCGSAEDLARWAHHLAAGDVVRPASYRRMTTSDRLADGTVPAYGFGVSLVPLDGRHRRVAHGGRMAGFTGTLAYYPDHDLAVAVLTNRGGLWIEAVEQAVARAVLGLARPTVRDVRLSAREGRAYVGAYDVGVAGFIVRVTEHDGRLRLAWPQPGPTSTLLHQGGRTFAAELEPETIGATFGPPDRSGRARSVILPMAGMHWYGRRIP